MSLEKRPKAPASQAERDAMANRILESAEYVDDNISRSLIKLIRKGLVYVYPNSTIIEITEEGEKVVEEGLAEETYNA
jgi:DNA-binding MarR family transcriptional regulator